MEQELRAEMPLTEKVIATEIETGPYPTTKEDSDGEDIGIGQSSDFSEKSWKAISVTCIPIACVCLLVWLDGAILATAIPQISDEFDSFDQIGWYGPSYLFGLCASQLLFGRVYKDFPSKIIYLISLVIFEAASILQAAAPSSEAFIVGRVFAGMGGSGVLTGSLTIFSEEVPKAKLPYVMGTFGGIHSIGGIAGPVIGGAITSSSLTWRWCFYLNPIISVAAMLPIFLLWRGTILPARDNNQPPVKTILTKLDYLGALTLAASVVALLLGLQFGGSTFSWSDSRTIASLAVAGVLCVLFSAVEWWKGDEAILPGRIVGEKTVLLSSAYTIAADGAYFILVYEIPLWFQTISGLSARDSGYRILPLLASFIFAAMTGTALSGKLRFYHPFMLFGSILLTIGSGLLTTLHPGAPPAAWVIFQILAGAGTGFGSPLTMLAVQDVLQPSDVPIGYAVVLMAGYLSSSITLAIAQAVFASQLRNGLQSQLPEINPDVLVNIGATDLESLVPSDMYGQALQLFNTALTRSWFISVGLSGISVFLMFGFKWKRMDMRDQK